MRELRPEPLTQAAFAPFGTVIQTEGADHFEINGGSTTRFHALAEAETVDGTAILSIFRGRLRPDRTISMLECHPDGSQAFMPLTGCLLYTSPSPRDA